MAGEPAAPLDRAVTEWEEGSIGMKNRMGKLGGWIAPLSLGTALMLPAAAWAQFGSIPGTGLGSMSNRSVRTQQQQNANTRQEPPPPALPGTKPAGEAAAPTQLPSDMSPTDALFDAINRGDVATAREAVNRGANLEGHNLLGLTPLELAVDLGRNDIS